jgi:hypothetical protein
MADALLCGCIKSSASVDAHDQGLGWGEPTTAVEELSQRASGQSFGHNKHVALAIERDFTVVKHRLNTRVTQARSNVGLLLKGS